ncbi:MAG: methyltransferase domain-containing protein [Gammaproteobacteria bacterium]|nr:methyltransferase domain-containing protein [Gammaproteobacteria bacterium]
MSNSEKIDNAWLNSEYGQTFLDSEKTYTDRAFRHISGPRVLQIGELIDDRELRALDFPQWVRVYGNQVPNGATGDLGSQITATIADAAFLPFEPDSFSSVILPHVLEGHSMPHQVLRESHRVLRPEGDLILTGFNPMSLVSLQRFVYPRAALKGNYYSVKRVKDWLQLLGFEVIASAIYQYAPLCKNVRIRNAVNFINLVGDRWLPMAGGGYMIRARKRQIGMTLVGRLQLSARERRQRKLANSVSANVSANLSGKPGSNVE